MKRILIYILAVSASVLTSCSDWNDPENLSYLPDRLSESDPGGYAQYLASVRAYNETAHNVMIVTMEGASAQPSARPQHLSNMPDSTDIISVKNATELHSSIAAEISEVYGTMGTRSAVFVDYSTIDEAWNLLEDSRSDAGEPAGTAEEAMAYFRGQAELQIAACDAYGFDGIMVSFEGTATNEMPRAKLQGFLGAALSWRETHPDALLIVRGSIRNIYSGADSPYKDFIEGSDYLVLVAGEVSAPVQLLSLVTRNLGNYAPKDRVILEVSVPSSDSPAQTGPSCEAAAQWVLDYKDYREFTPLGLCVGNAADDYYRQDMIYRNIRRAISIMNPAAPEE